MVKGKKKTSHEISYIEDPGQVKFHLRRPVHLYVPTEIRDSGEYDPLLETEPPSEELALHHVHGYRGRDARNNFLLLATGDVVYFTAGVAVVYDPTTDTQRIYDKHTDDIKSLALHSDGVTVATGQAKGVDDEEDAAHIRIWDTKTLETLHVFGEGKVNRAVSCLAFCNSNGGSLLAAVDDSPEPILTVWEWADENLLAECKCSGDPVIAVNFSCEDNPRVITTGKNSIIFWELDDEKLKKRTGIFGKHPKPKYVTAISFTGDGNTISGDSNGNVIVWKKGANEIERLIPSVHEGSIFSISVSKNGGYITTGKDRLVKLWNDDFSSVSSSVEIPEYMGGARAAIEIDEDLFVATINNVIAKGNFDDGFEVVTKGANDELWALAAHPSSDRYVTGSLDGVATERSIGSKKIVWSATYTTGVQSTCYSPGGEVIVLGFSDGKWCAMDAETRELFNEGQVGDEPVQVCRFSPDGSLLALGSRDNKVYVFDVAEEYKEYSAKGECEGHSSFIRSLDFSSDGSFLQTNSGDYELLYWKLEDCSQEPDSADMRDVEWATRTCLLSFVNFGVWPMGVDGTDLNAVSGAHSKGLVTTADDFGKVKIFKDKTHFAYTANKKYFGHSSHVTNAVFSHDDEFVISIGGNDKSVLEWKVSE